MKFTTLPGKKKLLLGGGIVVIGVIIFLVVRGGALIASVIYEPGGGTSSGQYDMATADADVCVMSLGGGTAEVEFNQWSAPSIEDADKKAQATEGYDVEKKKCAESGIASEFKLECKEPEWGGIFNPTYYSSTCTYSCTSLQKNCCGNKKTEGEVGETCDMANSKFPDPKHPLPGNCRAPGEQGECTNMRCGDGIEDKYDKPNEGMEECDDGGECDSKSMYTKEDGTTGFVTEREKCAVNGFNPQCKDFILDKPTECKSEQGDGCDDLCREEKCPNGRVDFGEACDDGGDSEGCDNDCTVVICGDGHTNEFIIDQQSGQKVEECDNGSVCTITVYDKSTGKFEDRTLECTLGGTDKTNSQCRDGNGVQAACNPVSDPGCVGCKMIMLESEDMTTECHSTPSGCEGTCDDGQFCGLIIGVCGCMYPDDSGSSDAGME